MQITLLGKTLLESLQLLSRIPTRHPSQPVLAYTCLSVLSDNTLEIRASGIGIMGRVIITTESVEESGRVALDQNTLITFLSSVKNMSTVTLKVNEGVLHVISGDSEADVKTYPYESMPDFTPVVGDPWYEGSSTLFTDLVKRVAFACAVSDIRPELASVYIAIKQGYLVCAATDSFYLAEAKAPCEQEEGTLLLPNKYVPHVFHTAAHSSKITITTADGMCQFDSGSCSIVVRIVSGSYPQYEAIIPKEFQIQIETSRDEVVTALRVIKPFTDAQFPKIMLKPNSDEGLCVCETDYNDKGYGKSSFRALVIGELGDDITIKVNLDNIMKIMAVLSVERITFSCIDPMKPIMVTSPDDVNFRALLMPVGR